MRFETKLAGIPCQCQITYFDPGTYSMRGHPDTWDQPEPPYMEWQILDARGRHAPWLERKAKPEDHDRIFREATAQMGKY